MPVQSSTFVSAGLGSPSSERLGHRGTEASAFKDAQHSWLSNLFLQSTDVIVKSVNLGSYCSMFKNMRLCLENRQGQNISSNFCFKKLCKNIFLWAETARDAIPLKGSAYMEMFEHSARLYPKFPWKLKLKRALSQISAHLLLFPLSTD